MKTISLTVPMDYNALTRASDMLHGLAIDLKHEGGEPAKTVESETHAAEPEAAVTSAPSVGASTTAVDDQHVTEPAEPAATEVFGGQSLFAEQPAEAPKQQAAETANSAAVTDTPQPGTPTPSTTTQTETATPVPDATVPAGQNAPAGVDVAPATTNLEVSIPWDTRIHSGSKAKLAKKPNGWKMKRGVAADLVATVEAELMAAMSASPANPVTPNEPAPASAPAPAAATTTPSTPAAPAQPEAPAQPAAPAGTISTFPELMAKITASGIDQATVTAAVNKQGLQALPLLAARPDLIPAVAAELFPGG